MLKLFQQVLEQFKHDCLESGYEVLLEADVYGWLFHLLSMQSGVDFRRIHLDTRVRGSNRPFDLVVGPIDTEMTKRPCIRPDLVVEIKVFPKTGFTSAQNRVHYEYILNDDLPKLGNLDATIELRAALVIDGHKYLQGTYLDYNRREYLIQRRDQVAPGVHLFIIHLTNNGWQIEHL